MMRLAWNTTQVMCSRLLNWFRLSIDIMALVTRLQVRAIGSQFNWTLNQEVVFSAASLASQRRSYSSRNIVGGDA